MDKTFELRNSLGYIAEAISLIQRAECLLENAVTPMDDPEGIEAAIADLQSLREDLLGWIAAPYNEAVDNARQEAFDSVAAFFHDDDTQPTIAIPVEVEVIPQED